MCWKKDVLMSNFQFENLKITDQSQKSGTLNSYKPNAQFLIQKWRKFRKANIKAIHPYQLSSGEGRCQSYQSPLPSAPIPPFKKKPQTTNQPTKQTNKQNPNAVA